MTLALDFNTSLGVFQLEGPSDAWFGVGWDSDEMPNTYAMIVTSSSVVERTLGTNSGGSVLTSTITVFNDTTDGDVRTVTFIRSLAAASSSYYNFSDVTNTTEIDIIWAVGSSTTFSQHTSSNRGSTSMSCFVF